MYNKLKSLKKVSEVEQKQIFSKYILFGENVTAYKTLLWLQEKFGLDSVLWLTERELSPRTLSPILPTTLRGEQNIAHTDIEGFHKTESLFYKEMKFRSFQGRSKSMQLLPGEEFYTQEGYYFYDHEDVNLDDYMDIHKVVHIEKIHKTTPTDLVDKKEWEIHTANQEIISCEHLIWAFEPLELYSLVEEKSELKLLNDYMDNVESLTQLYISLIANKKVDEGSATYFIPLSFSSEEGHFIGQFYPCEEKGEQRLDFIHFFDDTNFTEDDVIKKIKNLKRNLKKIFDLDKSSDFISEYYSLRMIDIGNEHKDAQVRPLFDQLKTLHFVGENAPLLEAKPVTHMVRADQSLEQLKLRF